MEWLIDLWLPVLVITGVLFVASFLAWVVLPHHKPDIRRWPDEDRLLEFIRQSGARPGEYMFPLIDEKDMREDWARQRYAKGPWGMVNVWAGQPNMGANMVKTVLFFLAVTLLIGYAGHAALAPGAAFGEVFQLVGTMAILAYAAGGMLREIWFTRPLRAKLMDVLDGLVFGIITGVLFALMWP
jgi:hypothetical protein